MEALIAIIVGTVAMALIMLVCSSARFENTKSTEFRRLEAERERRWLDYQSGWYDRRGR